MDRIGLNVLINSGGARDAFGNLLVDMWLLSTEQKGLMGDLFGSATVRNIIPDGVKIGRVPGVGQTGIDDLFRVGRSDVDYVVIEYKFDKSKLAGTQDGLQMSDSWLRGDVTKYDRVLEAVGGDKIQASQILTSLNSGWVEKWVDRTLFDGSTEVKVLDSFGRQKLIDTSKILVPSGNPYGY